MISLRPLFRGRAKQRIPGPGGGALYRVAFGGSQEILVSAAVGSMWVLCAPLVWLEVSRVVAIGVLLLGVFVGVGGAVSGWRRPNSIEWLEPGRLRFHRFAGPIDVDVREVVEMEYPKGYFNRPHVRILHRSGEFALQGPVANVEELVERVRKANPKVDVLVR